jgi:putative membrane protein
LLAQTPRQEVTARGAKVMPFDLQQTTMCFRNLTTIAKAGPFASLKKIDALFVSLRKTSFSFKLRPKQSSGIIFASSLKSTKEAYMKNFAKAAMAIVAFGWLTTGVVWAQRPYEWEWGRHPMWWMWGAWGIGMMLMMLLFWGLVIVSLVLGIRWLLRQARETRSDSALEILRQRYARGELTKDEFERMKKDLQ